MGYSTSFKGRLKFKKELTASQISELSKLLGKDRRDFDFKFELIGDDDFWYHIDLEFTPDYSGLQWDGSEKTYGMIEIINSITNFMKKKYPDFELIGKLSAQGEDAEDRWTLEMKDGEAVKKELQIKIKECVCPICKEKIKKVRCYACEEELLIGDLK